MCQAISIFRHVSVTEDTAFSCFEPPSARSLDTMRLRTPFLLSDRELDTKIDLQVQNICQRILLPLFSVFFSRLLTFSVPCAPVSTSASTHWKSSVGE